MAHYEVTHIGTQLSGVFNSTTQKGAVYEAARQWGNQVKGQGKQWTSIKVKAPKKVSEPRIMKKYYICKTRYMNDNTPEFGYGDYPSYTPYVSLIVEAETRRLAQNKAKKLDPKSGYSFGGQFGNLIYTDADLPDSMRREWQEKSDEL